MRKLRGELDVQNVPSEFSIQEESNKVAAKDPMDALHQCAQCFLLGRRDFMKPPRAFGACTSQEIWSRITVHGSWARCVACAETANSCRAAHGLPPLLVVGHTDVAQPLHTGIVCPKCQTARPSSFYTMGSVRKRTRHEQRICNVCKSVRFCDSCKRWLTTEDIRDERVMCATCEEVPCAICGQLLPQSRFDRTSLKHHFSAHQNVGCTACKSQGKVVREGAFRKLRADRNCAKCDR